MNPKDDLMSFDASPEKQTDLMCFEEPAPVSSKKEVNLLEIDNDMPSVVSQQLPVVTNQLSDVNRILEQTKEELAQSEANLKRKEGELMQV